jgi:hypothetical protein
VGVIFAADTSFHEFLAKYVGQAHDGSHGVDACESYLEGLSEADQSVVQLLVHLLIGQDQVPWEFHFYFIK